MMTPNITPEDFSGGFLTQKYKLRMQAALNKAKLDEEKAPVVPWPPKWLME